MSLSKKLRFEIFKRDKFSCQYCDKSAPDVILEVDHIHPKAEGGTDDILNLVTSCHDCNAGKNKRKLSDDAVIKKRKKQLDVIQERREQLEMLVEWQKSLFDIEDQTVKELANIWAKLCTAYRPNESGLNQIRQWLKRFTVVEIAEAMRISTKQYLKFEDDKITAESASKAWDYTPKIATGQKHQQGKPYLKDLYYIRGILRNRLSYINEWMCVKLMEQALEVGVTMENLKEFALQVKNWTQFRETLETTIASGKFAPSNSTDGEQ